MNKSTIEYVWIERAFNHFNKHLFHNRLPGCFFTYRRKSKALGLFSFNSFQERQGQEQISEIALNPDYFKDRPDIKILSDLAHEMVHLWQYYCGKSSRPGYHNREWADMMQEIGLMPSATGAPGGARTGQKMSDYIITGHHMFEYQANIIIKRGFRLSWESIRRDTSTPGRPRTDKKNKIKYTCPECGANVWGKPGLHILCLVCDLPFDSVQGQDDGTG